jgi:adenosine kinase
MHSNKRQKMSDSKRTEVLDGVLLGMGNPLLDISANVGDDMLKKYNVKLGNAILCEDSHKPVYKDLVDNHQVTYVAGGATQNSIRVAQWMLNTSDKATSFIGCVGKDAFGEQLRKSAEGDNVSVYYREDSKVATGTCACLIKDTERSLIANLSAANEYKIDHLTSDAISQVWQKAQYYYIAGFFLTVSPPSIMHLAKHANENGKPFCMNLSAPFICEYFNEPLLAALPYVDIMFGNESEAEAFGKKMGYADTSPRGVCLEIAKHNKVNKDKPRVCVITQGSKPTICAVGEKVCFSVDVANVDNIVDANGAGDAFVGGFLSQLIRGRDLVNCISAGNYAASVILGVSGTVLSGTPTWTPF